MSKNRTSDGRAEKGSKYWMQGIADPSEFINEPEYPIFVKYHRLIGNILESGTLTWLSPLHKEKYHEYRLNEKREYKKYSKNIKTDTLCYKSDAEFREDFKFWPSQHPVWDAIAIAENGKELYLFEAKAHVDETLTQCGATSPKSIKRIRESMGEAYKYFSQSKAVDDDKLEYFWMKQYYQLGNRLTFLYYMNNRLKLRKDKHTTLVLLNIVDDKYGKTGKADWDKHYKSVFHEMIGYEEPPEDVKIVYIPD